MIKKKDILRGYKILKIKMKSSYKQLKIKEKIDDWLDTAQLVYAKTHENKK